MALKIDGLSGITSPDSKKLEMLLPEVNEIHVKSISEQESAHKDSLPPNVKNYSEVTNLLIADNESRKYVSDLIKSYISQEQKDEFIKKEPSLSEILVITTNFTWSVSGKTDGMAGRELDEMDIKPDLFHFLKKITLRQQHVEFLTEPL